jgi:hypothetical protein
MEVREMRTGTYYLNNSGSRWVNLVQGKRAKGTFTTKSGKTVTRSVNYYSSFGNWATCNISYKGKRINVFLDTLLED